LRRRGGAENVSACGGAAANAQILRSTRATPWHKVRKGLLFGAKQMSATG
jgi:hypothetical protein